MKSFLPTVAALAAAGSFAASTQAQLVIWDIDFESPDQTDNSGAADFEAAGSTSFEIIDVTGSAVEGLGGFAGNAALVSLGTGTFNNVRSNTEITLDAAVVAELDTYELSFDLFVNSDVDPATGDVTSRLLEDPNFQARLEASGTSGNGPGISYGVTATSTGLFEVSITGNTADIVNGAGPFDAARPFLAFFGDGVASADALFIDNINFSLVPEPSSLGLIGLGTLALVRRSRKSA